MVYAGDMQPPLTVVLINNGGGGIFSFLPIADAVMPEVFTSLWATPQNVDLAGLIFLFVSCLVPAECWQPAGSAIQDCKLICICGASQGCVVAPDRWTQTQTQTWHCLQRVYISL